MTDVHKPGVCTSERASPNTLDRFRVARPLELAEIVAVEGCFERGGNPFFVFIQVWLIRP